MSKIIPGVNDLNTTNHELASQWHPTKNGDLTPFDVSAGSGKKVWWLCEKGHEWQAQICSRSKKSQGCPYCSGRRPIPGETDLATLKPAVAAEWHPTKNGSLTPDQVSCFTHKEAWWLCPACGHEWKSSISNRSCGNGCPRCSGKVLIVGANDLGSQNPELAAQWHPTKNGNLTPSDVSQNSGIKVWWLGKCGHEWEAKVSNRQIRKDGCPICSGLKILPGFNDLATLFPKIAAEWHPTKNGDFTPDIVSPGSHRKAWWRCEKGHEWETTVNNRTHLGRGCPECARKKSHK